MHEWAIEESLALVACGMQSLSLGAVPEGAFTQPRSTLQTRTD
jgi:hypothetical protein